MPVQDQPTMLAWKSFTASKEIPSFKENPGRPRPPEGVYRYGLVISDSK